MFLFIIAAIALVAVFLLISTMQDTPSAEPMTEMQAPDNSTGKVVPRLYGKARMYGNNIFYGNLSSIAIVVDT